MSLTKPDSLSEGNPYAYGSKGALLFQRAFFMVLFLALSGIFIYKLASEKRTRVNPEILVLRFADSTPDLNLGVPFQQADLDLIQNTLELKPEQDLIASLDAFRDRVRELQERDRSAAIIYLKGYGSSISRAPADLVSEAEDGHGQTREAATSIQPATDQPESSADPAGDARQTDSRVFVRLNGEEISASEIVDAVFRVDDKPDKQTQIATQLLVLDCSQAVSNFRIGMFSNSFPAKIAETLQRKSTAVPRDHWVLLPCGVNQLSYPSPDMKNTAFAKAFADGLKGRADSLDDWGNRNGTVELKELYDYICSVCAFEFQQPLLLNHQGVAVTPFDLSNPEDRGPVLAVVPPENTTDSDPAAATDGKPQTDQDKANPSEQKEEESRPKTVQNSSSFDSNSPRVGLSHVSSNGRGPFYGGLANRPWLPILRSTLLLTDQQSTTPAAGNPAAPGPQGEDPSAEPQKQQTPNSGGSTSSQNSATDNTKGPQVVDGVNQAAGEKKPESQDLNPWDSMRVQLLQNLKKHRNAKLDFVAARLQMAEAAEKDFRQRFLAGDLESPASGSVLTPMANNQSPDAPERDDLVKARARAASTGKAAALEKAVLAWDALLEARFLLPSFVEWHDHLSILDPVGAADFRQLVAQLWNDLEQLEAEIQKFETPSVLDEVALEDQTAKTKQALNALTHHVSISLQEASPGLLYSVLRTSLLSGQERNDVVARLGSRLKDRSRELPNASAVKSALEDPETEQHFMAVSELRLRLDESRLSETTEASGELLSADHLPESNSNAKIKDVVSWLRLASSLSQAQCRTAHTTPMLPVPIFPLEPKLRLVLAESDEAQKRLIPKERRSLRFILRLSDLEEAPKPAEIGTELRFAVDPPDAIDLRIRSASLNEQPLEPDAPYRFALDSSGELQFELLAEATDYVTRPSTGSVLPAVSIRAVAAARIGEANLSAEVPATLPLPVRELIVLEVEGDPRIPQSAGSHNRTLRILPNTVTLSKLKLRNKTLRARTVRVDVFALKELPDATWPPGLLYASDPSSHSEPPLFPQLKSILDNKAEETRLLGPLVAQSGPFLLPVNTTDSDPAILIPFTTPAAAPPTTAPVTASTEPAAAQPPANSLPDVSHGLFVRVIDLKETKNGDTVALVDGNESWPHWLEVNPLHPRALFDASAEWNHSRKEVQVRIDRKLVDDVKPSTAGPQKTTVRFTLADRQGWPISQSDTRNLTADGYTFPNVEASEDPHVIFVDIDGYPRALVIDLECRNEKDSLGSLNNNWTNVRFSYFGSESEGLFVRQPDGFSWTRKEAKNLPQRLFQTPFFVAKAAENESKSRQGIPVGLQIDGGFQTDRRPASGERADAQSPVLKGVRELESLRFPRDRHHQEQLTAAQADGTLAIASKVEDWRTEWTPATDGDLVDLKVGLFPQEGNAAQDPDQVSVLIDGTPPEFRLSPLSLAIEEGTEGLLEIQQRDPNPSAPVERIEFNIVDADEPEQVFAEEAIVKNLTVSWPAGKTQQIKIVPAKLMKPPGRYLIKARTTDALGQQNSDVAPVELVVRKKPAPEPEMKDDTPKKGTVRLRFLYNGMPLKQSAKLEVTVSGETKDKDSAVDGVIEFSKETELDKPVDVVVKWSVRRNTTLKTVTRKINPVAKDKDVEITIESLEEEVSKK